MKKIGLKGIVIFFSVDVNPIDTNNFRYPQIFKEKKMI